MTDDFVHLLFQTLAEGTNVQNLIDIARTERFTNPIMVTNEAFRTVALSYEEDFDDPVWNDSRRFRGFSEEIIDTFKNDQESGRLFREGKTFLYDTGLGARIPRILAPIGTPAGTSGYLIIFGASHPIRGRDLDDADSLAQALHILMSRNAAEPNLTLGLSDYTLQRLLKEEKPDPELLAGIHTEPYFMAAAALLKKDAKDMHYAAYIEETILHRDPSLHCFSFEGNLFILINYREEEEAEKGLADIRRVLEHYGLPCGVSNSFADIRDLPLYYRQAVQTRATGSRIFPDRLFFRYEDVMPYCLIRRLEDPDIMLSKQYRQLRNCDEVHSSELTETLHAWFSSGMNRSGTAEKMHTHRNTIAYRLDLIREKLGIDISDMDILMNFELSYKIGRWFGKERI